MPWRPSAPTPTSSSASSEPKPREDKIKPTTSRITTEQHGSFGQMKEPTAAKVDPIQQDEPATAATSASTTSSPDPASAEENTSAAEVPHSRSLAWRNFEQALKEITPSASESLGSLAELRKWNDEFGEGRRTKKTQVWGKGRFGFTLPALEMDAKLEPGGPTPPTTTTMPNAAHSNTGSEH